MARCETDLLVRRASVLNSSIVVCQRVVAGVANAADRFRNPFQHKRFSKAIDVYCSGSRGRGNTACLDRE